MEVDGLPIPAELLDLVAGGHWPRGYYSSQQSFGRSPILEAAVRRVADDETQI
jgi:hypothetical protein